MQNVVRSLLSAGGSCIVMNICSHTSEKIRRNMILCYLRCRPVIGILSGLLIMSTSIQFSWNEAIFKAYQQHEFYCFQSIFKAFLWQFFNGIISKCKNRDVFFHCINICQIPRKMFEHWACSLLFKQLPLGPANINA